MLAQAACNLEYRRCWTPSAALPQPLGPLRPCSARVGRFLVLTSPERRLQWPVLEAEGLAASCWDFPVLGTGSPPLIAGLVLCMSVVRTTLRRSQAIGRLEEDLRAQRNQTAAPALICPGFSGCFGLGDLFEEATLFCSCLKSSHLLMVSSSHLRST